MTKARTNADNALADITGVTAGTGISGGGTTGTPTVAIDTAVTADLSTAQTLANKTLTAPIENNSIFKSPQEVWTTSATAATGVINFDAKTQGVLYYTTNASANFTLNFRGDAGVALNTLLATGQAITVSFLNTNGATAYYASAFQVDGSAVTPKWSGGVAPTAGNALAIDAWTFTILKTASATFTIFANPVIKFA